MRNILLSLFFLACSLHVTAQSRAVSESVKKEVFARDEGKCRCCGSTGDIEYDHIIPFSRGGSSEACNIQLLCMACNRSKSDDSHCGKHSKRLDTGSCDIYKDAPKKHKRISTRCTALTKEGKRCKNRTYSAGGRCHLH